MTKPILLTAKTLLGYRGIRYGAEMQFDADKADAEKFIASGQAVETKSDESPAVSVPAEPSKK